MNTNQVSIVICNRNSVNFLKKSIPVYKKNKFYEIMVIDGNSSDESVEYLKKEKIKIISDGGKGLSFSRNLGVINSSGDYIFIAGPDDVCDITFFDELLKNFCDSGYDAATNLLKIINPLNYWDHSLNLWFKYIRKIGSTSVIGTPTLFKRKVFNKVSYKEKTIGFDDTDISDQLLKNKFKIGILDVYCNQANGNNFKDISKKFKLYGNSDINYFRHHNQNKKNYLSLIKTYLHPVKHFFKFSYFLIRNMEITKLPFAFLVTFYRYVGITKTN